MILNKAQDEQHTPRNGTFKTALRGGKKGDITFQDTSLDHYLEAIEKGTFKQYQTEKEKAPAYHTSVSAIPSASLQGPDKDTEWYNIRTEGIKQHSGILCLDIDIVPDEKYQDLIRSKDCDKHPLSQADRIMAVLKEQTFVYAIHRSFSGNGIVAYVKVDDPLFEQEFEPPTFLDVHHRSLEQEQVYQQELKRHSQAIAPVKTLHKNMFIALARHFKKLNILLDRNTFALIQNRVVSNSKVWRNPLCQPFTITDDIYLDWQKSEETKTVGRDKDKQNRSHNYAHRDALNAFGDAQKTFNHIYEWCKENDISLIEDNDIGKNVIACLAKNNISRKDVHRLSKLSNSYDRPWTEAQYEWGLSTDLDSLGIIVNIAKKQGYQLPDQKKNNFEKQEEFIAKRYKAYTEDSWFRDELKANTLTSADGTKYLDQHEYASLKFDMKKEMYSSVKERDIQDILNGAVDLFPVINPFTEHLKKYTPCKKAFDTIIDELVVGENGCNASERNTKLRPLVEKFFYSVILNACFKGIKKSPLMLIMHSDVHGTGKSRFIKTLLGQRFSEGYIVESLAEDYKDRMFQLSSSILIYDTECQYTLGVKRSNVGSQKSLLDMDTINVRLPYATHPQIFVRRCSFIGSTNDDALLKERNNRRLICLNIEKLRDTSRLDINVYQGWAYALEQVQKAIDRKEQGDFNYWQLWGLTKDEERLLQELSSEFIVDSQLVTELKLQYMHLKDNKTGKLIQNHNFYTCHDLFLEFNKERKSPVQEKFLHKALKEWIGPSSKKYAITSDGEKKQLRGWFIQRRHPL